jgi:predicted lipid-binding transport protein (Tim44 family)
MPTTPSTPSTPSRTFNQPAPAPTMPQRPGFFSRFGGALAGFALGGLLGSLLFHGGWGGGFGLMDIVIVGGLALLAWQFFRRRRESQDPVYATDGRYADTPTSPASTTNSTLLGADATPERTDADVQRGIGHIRQMDPGFDPEMFGEWARTCFTNVQSAVAMRDAGMLRDRLTPEMYGVLQGQCDQLRAGRRTNYIEKIQIERSQISEAWQETGQDFVTVYLAGSLLDYVVDDASGQVVEGSKTQPQTLEEGWTFTRPVGPNKWKLCAIQPV